MQTHGNGPQEPLITSLSKFRGPPEWCEVRRKVLYKICNKCISRARTPRGRDAWDALIDIKSDSTFSKLLIFSTDCSQPMGLQSVIKIRGKTKKLFALPESPFQ
jgi:hypothetical protein